MRSADVGVIRHQKLETKQRYWLITGWDGTTMLYEKAVKQGLFSENKMKDLLRTLTAKHGLTEDEFLASYARKNSKIAAPHLEVQVSGKPHCLSCGDNPFFTAQVKYKEEINKNAL